MSQLIQVLASGVVDSTGAALSAGTVTFYEAGTTTLFTVYQDGDATIPHTNPATLDSAGMLVAYATENVKLVIADSTGAFVRTMDNVILENLTESISLTTGADADDWSGTTQNDVNQAVATSLGDDAEYKYLTVGSTRTYLSRGSDRVSVKDFGATGDGVTDDTDSVNAACSALTSGGELFFPIGNYICTDDITVTAANTTLSGAGKSSKITISNGKSIKVTASGFQARNLWISSEDANSIDSTNSRLLNVYGADSSHYLTDIIVENCLLTLCRGQAVNLEYVRQFIVRHNTITDIVYAGVMVESCDHGVIEGNIIQDINQVAAYANSYGIALSRSAGTEPLPYYITVCDNVIKDNHIWEGIDTHGGHDLVIANNVIRDCGSAIVCGPGSLADAPKRIAITGNQIYGTTPGTNSTIIVQGKTSGLGTVTDWAENFTVSGNTLYKTGPDAAYNGAIFVQAAKDVTISGNSIIEPQRAGIILSWDCYGMSVTGNSIVDPWSDAAATTAGIWITTGNVTAIISGNNVRSGGKAATSVCGSFLKRVAASWVDGVTNIVLGDNFSEATTYYDGINATYGMSTSYVFPARYNADAAPTAGTWIKGEKVFQSSPDQGDPSAWTCTAAGTPGTWVRGSPIRNETWAATDPSGSVSGTAGDIQWLSTPTAGIPGGYLCVGTTNWLAIPTVHAGFALPSVVKSNDHPTTGTWYAGDICMKTTVSDAAGAVVIGWICTLQGAPGTWREITVTLGAPA